MRLYHPKNLHDFYVFNLGHKAAVIISKLDAWSVKRFCDDFGAIWVSTQSKLVEA